MSKSNGLGIRHWTPWGVGSLFKYTVQPHSLLPYESNGRKRYHFVCQFFVLLYQQDAQLAKITEYIQTRKKRIEKWYIWKHSLILLPLCRRRNVVNRPMH